MKAPIQRKLTVREQRALDAEINRQIALNVPKLEKNIMAMVLWQLHEQLGFGKDRLIRFHESFAPYLKQLQEYYEMESDEEAEWLVKKQLREIGVDVDSLGVGMTVAVQTI